MTDGTATVEEAFEFDSFFAANYARVARLIARVVKDPARAEELAVDVFCKLWRNPRILGEQPEAWIYRIAVRAGLDELRRQIRQSRYEGLLAILHRTPTPEQLHAASEEQERVRGVLAALKPTQAEILILRSNDLSYEELASALNLNPASVGTLIRRAQEAFRKEYIKHYGKP